MNYISIASKNNSINWTVEVIPQSFATLDSFLAAFVPDMGTYKDIQDEAERVVFFTGVYETIMQRHSELYPMVVEPVIVSEIATETAPEIEAPADPPPVPKKKRTTTKKTAP